MTDFHKLISSAALALSLISCAKSDDKKDNSFANNDTNEKMTDRTDRTKCTGPAEYGLNLYKDWSMTQVSENLKMKSTLSFTSNQLTITNICKNTSGDQIAARLRVPISVVGNTLEILRDDSDSQTKNTSQGKISCSVSIRRSTSTYRLVGSCLELKSTDFGTLTMPQNDSWDRL